MLLRTQRKAPSLPRDDGLTARAIDSVVGSAQYSRSGPSDCHRSASVGEAAVQCGRPNALGQVGGARCENLAGRVEGGLQQPSTHAPTQLVQDTGGGGHVSLAAHPHRGRTAAESQ